MASQTLRRPQPWTLRRRAALVLRLLRGETTIDAEAEATGLEPAQLAAWRDAFLSAGEEALRAGADASQSVSRSAALARTAPVPAQSAPAPSAMGGDKRVYDDVAQAVGRTPLVRLRGFPGDVYAKLEFLNPMGSAKDRVARHFVEKAAADGRLAPGATLVEASSGNTAMGLGMMAVLRGYKCKVAVRDRTSKEKVDALRAIGVEVEVVDGSLPPDHPESYNRVMARIVAETPGCYFPDQHNNRENNEAHYRSTGPELWEQMDGRIDVFVAGVGTGGTIGGVARYLKEKDPRVRVVGVDPVGSVFGQFHRTGKLGAPGPYLVEGLGDEELIGCFEPGLIDEMLTVTDKEAFACARHLARTDAILAGGSSGAAYWATREVARRAARPLRIATLFPDGGSRYLSKVYNEEWLRAKGLL